MDLSGVLLKLGFNWQLAVANLFNFLLVFWLLQKFIWTPLRAKIDERKQVIDKGLEDAQKAEAELVVAHEKGNTILDTAKQESGRILNEAKASANSLVAEARKDSKEESVRLLEKAERESEAMRAEAMKKVKQESVDLIISSTRAVLKEEIDEKKGEKLIESLLKQA